MLTGVNSLIKDYMQTSTLDPGSNASVISLHKVFVVLYNTRILPFKHFIDVFIDLQFI